MPHSDGPIHPLCWPVAENGENRGKKWQGTKKKSRVKRKRLSRIASSAGSLGLLIFSLFSPFQIPVVVFFFACFSSLPLPQVAWPDTLSILMIIFGNGEHFFFFFFFFSSPFCLRSLAMVVAAATPRAGSRVKTGRRGGRAGGAAATRSHFAATRRCSRRALRRGLREGTGTPVWLVTKSTNSRNHEIKIKTKKKKSRYLGPR